jgi:ketosteroid isomerase-like protein
MICALILALTAIEGRGQKTQSADLSKIVALLQKHDNALNQHDLGTIMSVFAPTTNIVVLGTGPGERWSGKDEIRGAFLVNCVTRRTSSRTT